MINDDGQFRLWIERELYQGDKHTDRRDTLEEVYHLLYGVPFDPIQYELRHARG